MKPKIHSFASYELLHSDWEEITYIFLKPLRNKLHPSYVICTVFEYSYVQSESVVHPIPILNDMDSFPPNFLKWFHLNKPPKGTNISHKKSKE